MINYRYRFCTVIESVYTPRTWNYFTENDEEIDVLASHG
jgi:hypothetical protein